ncbi:MAG: Rnase Y domain-containing protein, partial [Candidatus Binatia bacterium]
MQTNLLMVVIGFLSGVILALIILWVRKKQRRIQMELARSTAARIIEEAKKEASAVKREGEIQAKDSILQAKVGFENEVRETRKELQDLERRLLRKEESMDRRVDALERRETEHAKLDAAVRAREKSVGEKEAESKRLIDDARRQLERVAGMSREEARKNLADQMVEEARYESIKRIRMVEEQAKEEADQKAKKIVTLAI